MFWDLEQFSSRTAIEQPDGRCISYSELAGTVNRFADKTPDRRSLVFLLVENDLDSLAAYLGCLRKDHVPLLLAANTNTDLLQFLEETYSPNVVWSCNDGFHVRHHNQIELNPELALLLSTSGSTGSPKLVRLSAQNINSNAESIAEYLHLKSDEKAITLLPMNYTYGLSVINSHLAVGATLLLTNYTVIQREFWDFFKKAGGTSLVGVPYTYQIYRRAGVFTKLELPTLRYMTQAGGKLPAEDVFKVATWSKEHGVRFYVMYGQTEATARMSYLPPECTLEKSASVGIAIPGGRFAIEDEKHNEITESGKDGELIYYGPNVSLGYAEKQQDLALPDTNNGRLSTGDVARWDDDHYVYITGRLKRFIKMTGNRIGLDEVEKRLRLRGLEAVCGGKDDLLAVALTSGDPAEAVQIISDEFKIHYSMIKAIVVSDIPRNDSGKIQYTKLFEGVL